MIFVTPWLATVCSKWYREGINPQSKLPHLATWRANNTRTSPGRKQPKSSYTILIRSAHKLFNINHFR